MDKIVDKLAALGVPGLIILVTMAISGWAGAAAITSALAMLGGPFGMLGGIAMLGILSLISKGIAQYGFERLFQNVVLELRKRGKTKADIEREVFRYPISKELKLKIKEYLNESSWN